MSPGERKQVEQSLRAFELTIVHPFPSYSEALRQVRQEETAPRQQFSSDAVTIVFSEESFMQKSRAVQFAEEALAKGQRSVNGVDAYSIILNARAEEIERERKVSFGEALRIGRGELASELAQKIASDRKVSFSEAIAFVSCQL